MPAWADIPDTSSSLEEFVGRVAQAEGQERLPGGITQQSLQCIAKAWHRPYIMLFQLPNRFAIFSVV